MKTRNKVIDFTKVESVKRSSSKRSHANENESSESKKFQSKAITTTQPKPIKKYKESASTRKPPSSKYANPKTKSDLVKAFSITVCNNDSENEHDSSQESVHEETIQEIKIKIEKLIDMREPCFDTKPSEVIDKSSVEMPSSIIHSMITDVTDKPLKNSKGVLTDSNRRSTDDDYFSQFDITYCPVLREVYDELDIINQGPSLLLNDNSKTVEHIWNDLIDSNAVNESMKHQESFLSSVSLLRIGVENAWLQKREERSEALSRRALGRLRPNPKRSNYADMVPSNRRKKFKKENEAVLKPVARRPGRPRQKDSINSNRRSQKSSLFDRHSVSISAFNDSRKRAVRIAKRARQQRNKHSSTPASVSDSDSVNNRAETRSSTLKLRPQRYLTGLRSGDVSSYISKRFCYGNDKGQGKVNSDYLHQKRKRKCAELKLQREKIPKKNKSDSVSVEPNVKLSLKKKSSCPTSASTSVCSTPVKETTKSQNQQPLPKPKLIQPLKLSKSTVQDNVTKLFEQRELHKFHKMQQRIEKESMRREKPLHGKMADWPPKDRELSILDRLIIGLDCELIRGNDPKGVELRGLSKPDFDKLRDRIRKSGYFFGYIQYYPEEENPNGRDEYDCCITSDENRRNMRNTRSANSDSHMAPDPKRQLVRKLQPSLHTAASTAAIKLSKKARGSYPQTAGAAKRKYHSTDDPDDSPGDMNRGSRENLSDIEVSLNEPSSFKQKPSYHSGSESDSHSIDDLLSGSPVVKKLGHKPTSLIDDEIPMHRRHSPKKVIRKVYTGSSSQPKILSKKRPTPLSGNTVINASASLLNTTRISEPPIHSTTTTSKIFSASSSTYRSSQSPSVSMRSSAVVTSSSASVPLTSQKSLIRHESQEFWRLKGVEQNQIMDKHILTPATAMTASEIMRLKRFEAETVRHPSEYSLSVNHNTGRTFNKMFHSTTNTVDSSSVTEYNQPAKIEIDGEETDDEFEFQLQLPSTTTQPLKLIPSNDPNNLNASDISRPPLSVSAELIANNNEDAASDDSPHKNSKRRVIHQFHTFRKILPKSASLPISAPSQQPVVPTSSAQPQTSQRPQFPLITSPQGRPMVPPVTAYANNPIIKSINSKSDLNTKHASHAASKTIPETIIIEPDEVNSKSDALDTNKGHTQLLKSLLESGRTPKANLQASTNTAAISLPNLAPSFSQTSNVNKSGYYPTGTQLHGRSTWHVNKPRVSVLPASSVGGLPGILPASVNSVIKPRSIASLPSDSSKAALPGVTLRVSGNGSGHVPGQSTNALRIGKCDSHNPLTQRSSAVASKSDIANVKLLPNNPPTR